MAQGNAFPERRPIRQLGRAMSASPSGKMMNPKNAVHICDPKSRYNHSSWILGFKTRISNPKSSKNNRNFCFDNYQAMYRSISRSFIYFIWVFPKIGGFPPQIIHWIIGFSTINHPFWGVLPLFLVQHPYETSFPRMPGMRGMRSSRGLGFFPQEWLRDDIMFRLLVTNWPRLILYCGNQTTYPTP